MKRAFPDQVTLDYEEQWHLLRVRIVERLHWTFDQVDNASYADICLLQEVWRADQIEADKHAYHTAAAQRRAMKRTRGSR